jgi:hypothetical protein
VPGRQGWLARYLKEVDASETTLRFWQEIYDDHGNLAMPRASTSSWPNPESV